MKILRAAIYLGALAFLLPSPPPGDSSLSPASLGPASLGVARAAPRSADGGDLIAAAIGAVGDVSGFCTRQPTVCDTAHGLLYKLEAKAKYSLHLIYQWVESPEQPRPALSTEATLNDPITTSTIAVGRERPAGDALRPADFLPKWRAPKRSGAG
jgi:hypothetical protein